jgi:iron complex outermembrane recepter protein
MPTSAIPIAAWGLLVRVIIGCVLWGLVAASMPVMSQAAVTRYELNIPRQPLDQALKEFAHQTGLQVARFSEVTRSAGDAGPVVGNFSPTQALSSLLAGSGLSYRLLDSRTVAIVSSREPGSAPSSNGHFADQSADDANVDPKHGSDQKAPGSFSDAFRMAQVDQETPGSQITTERGETERKVVVEEVVVTAQKREERLQDVPVPVSVVDTDALADRNQNRLQDYFAAVPGLSFGSGTGGGGTQTLAIRGITTGNATNPTVGITIDDVPYGSSTLLGLASLLYPDIDPSDLARVEVLRGPQGALYGASSIGGLIKFVTTDPSPSNVAGRIQVLGSHVQDGGYGHVERGAVNLPISEGLAVRVSGFARHDPGYVDNVLSGQDNVNSANIYGGRVSAFWQPSDEVSLKVNATGQNTHGNGSPIEDADSSLAPILGDLKQARLPQTGRYKVSSDLFSAKLTVKLGSADLTSITGYGINKFSDTEDATNLLIGCCVTPFFNADAASQTNDFRTRKFSQEIRLASISSQKLDWLVGAFYTHESSAVDQRYLANTLATGEFVGELINYNDPSTLAEYALFGDLTAHFSDRFDVQFGGRESHNRQTYSEVDTGVAVPFLDFGANAPAITPQQVTNSNAFTYLVTPRFKVSQDLMLYARFASGYRVGGPNFIPQLSNVPPTFGPDKTNNYELGAKGDIVDHILTFDASAYFISWRDIQLFVFNPETFGTYYINGGRAKSQGLELALSAKPSTGLKIAMALTAGQAKLTENLPTNTAVSAMSGDRLPYSSKFSGSLAVDQDFRVTSHWTGFGSATFSYVGAREGEFPSSPPRVKFPSYGDLDLRLGARIDRLTASLLLNNATNRRGVVGGGVGYAQSPYNAIFTQPRTVAFSVAATF